MGPKWKRDILIREILICVHMKGDATFMLYGDLPDILGFGRGDGVVIRTSLDRKTLTQGADSRRSVVRAQGCVESDSSNGSHKSLGKRDSQVSDTTRGMQGLLHSTRCNVSHALEPVPRDAAETTHLVVHRQRRLQRRLL